MHAWEERLSQVDTNRVTLPFDWGLEFLDGLAAENNPKDLVMHYNDVSIAESDRFFQPAAPLSFVFESGSLCFESSIRSPYACNNLVTCRIFSPEKSTGSAVIVVPQWNADANSHNGLCRLLSKFGITAVRLTLPYHETRNPSGPRADHLVSPNIGRTIQGIRQSVHDVRNIADWLQQQGYSKLGIMGTSVGSCISFLAFVHDERIQAGVFNHVSSFFGDVVWEGISTCHVRKGIEGYLNREELRKAWAAISPNSYVARLLANPRNRLFLTAKYDLTFPPDLAALLFEEHDRWNISYDVAHLPCGHYSSARTPFKHMVGYRTVSYFRKHLTSI
jgi:hypothetical protein